MMKCGCAANATCSQSNGKKFDPPIPSCAIHSCIEVAETRPDLTGRIARCAYHGAAASRNKNECSTCKRGEPCKCERPSDMRLAFFEYKPTKPFDTFYCGCGGWD